MPELDRPPTYSSVDPRQHTEEAQHQNDEKSNKDGRCSNKGYVLELHRAQDFARSIGTNIKKNGNTLYYVGHYQTQDTSDIILYGGYDSKGPWLAQASFPSFTKDFKIYVGEHKTPSNDDWDNVRCSGGGIFSDPSFRFECRSHSGKTRLYWKKTHDSKLGASRLSPRDYKLVDEITEEVVAVYVEKSLGSGPVRGSITFRQRVDERVEIASLMVVLSLLERSRRYMAHVGRTFPNTNSY